MASSSHKMPGDLARRSPLCMYINRCAERVHSSPCTGIRSTYILSRFSCCTRDAALTSTKQRVGARGEFTSSTKNRGSGSRNFNQYLLTCQTANAPSRNNCNRFHNCIVFFRSIEILEFLFSSFFFPLWWLCVRQALLIFERRSRTLFLPTLVSEKQYRRILKSIHLRRTRRRIRTWQEIEDAR